MVIFHLFLTLDRSKVAQTQSCFEGGKAHHKGLSKVMIKVV